MYLYIYDSCTKDKKYKNIINKIENRVVDLDIKGKIFQLNLLKNVSEFVREEMKRGAHTVVVVGTDKTFAHTLESVISQNIAIGYIPIDPKSKFANFFGIPTGELACNIVSGRIIKQIDVGQINQKFFLHSIVLNSTENLVVKIDDFKIRPEIGDKITIKNIDLENDDEICKSDPTDGVLEMIIEKPGNVFAKTSTHSLFKTKNISILSEAESVPMTFDEYQSINTPVKISVAKEKLNVIVGSNRQF